MTNEEDWLDDLYEDEHDLHDDCCWCGTCGPDCTFCSYAEEDDE